MNNLLSIALGFFLFVVTGFSLWIFIQSLLEADPGITAAVIGVIAVMVGGIWSYYFTRCCEINSRYFIEKKNVYMRLIDLIFDMFKAIKKETELTETEMFERMFEFKREVMVWGDQAVINALETYERKSAALLNNENPSETLLVVDDLLRAIRKDLGHDDMQLKRGSLVGMLLIAKDREELLNRKVKDGS
jgi:hypothetical protein